MTKTVAPPSPQAPSTLNRAITAVLRHPAAMTVKRQIRNAWWATVKGRHVVNPPLPDEVRSMLFVCLGNICRSPFAEHLARQTFERAGRADIRCASAGLSTRQAGRAPAAAVDVAAANYGLRLDEHRPVTLTAEMALSHDVIVVMETAQLEHVRRAFPHASSKTVLLPLFDPVPGSAFERYNIDDPFGRPRQVFEYCYVRIDRAVNAMTSAVQERNDRV